MAHRLADRRLVMSPSVRDDDADKPIRRGQPWVDDRSAQDRARHLADEVAAVAADLKREALRSRLPRSEQWDTEDAPQPRATDARFFADPNRGLWSPNLDPVIMPPPPREKGGTPGLKLAVGLVGAVGVAAGVAFALMHAIQGPPASVAVSGDDPARSQSFAAPVLGNLTQITVAEAKVPAPDAQPPAAALLANTQANAVAVTTPAPAVPQMSREVEPPRVEPAPPPPVAAVPEPRPIDPLSQDEVVSLRKRGQELIAVGDIASARLILTRLAEAGDADASLMLAGTFDANVLARLHVVGIRPDPAKAREWYAKAADLGSAEARQHLERSALR
jgi:hypothetical protein